MSWFSNITDYIGLTVKPQVGSPINSTVPTYGSSVLNPEAPKLIAQATGAAALTNPGILTQIVSTSSNVIKSVGTLAKNLFTSLTPVQKAATIVAAPIVTSAIVQSPKLQNAIVKTPTSLVNFGGNIGKLVENPSLKQVGATIKENPILSTVIGGVAVAAIGGGVGLAANTAATFLNTRATKENSGSAMPTTSDLGAAPSTISMPSSELIPSKSLTPAPTEAPSANLVAQPIKSPTTRKRKKRKAIPRQLYHLQPQVLNRITIGVGVHG